MTIPITFQNQPDFSAPRGRRSAALQFLNVANLERRADAGKQKT